MKNRRNIVEQKYPPENPNDLWMKDNVLYKSTHKGWTPLTAGGGSSTNGITSITWQELKDKRDTGKLTPGALYRITDYQCTTTQENTRSAGNQFDIVLLALSENNLAEEGWAMMNESNVYDVIFSDTTKKCYFYQEYEDNFNIVDITTLLGDQFLTFGDGQGNGVKVDFENKIVHLETELSTDCLLDENVPYNYFQNSKLEAWKVWYSLDNDTRFAWADDSVDEDVPASIKASFNTSMSDVSFTRSPESDRDFNGIHYYAWLGSYQGPQIILTISENPNIGDDVWRLYGTTVATSTAKITSFTPVHEGTGLPNGRGVIYRLIDEFNNDLPCDFKNILVTLRAVESYLITAINHIDDHQDYSMRGSIRDITVSLCLIDDGGGYKNAIPIGIIAPSLRYGEVIYNIKISSSALMGVGQLTDISSNTIIGYTI